ncbi:class I SAM-dependent methyltransferase [Neobacillus cucumis]|uniref:SAM-dependent methyltransferase n=1 Tax=Neobacillus cucumis TaxID=1740721 RepID=A0A2N5HNA1_9BACI|nr:class I SAM-dependent methyltransferase [Neobacillus cucumis]PLS06993.1 SAM-dependent methyltransferase [Neobacillus cucumis]
MDNKWNKWIYRLWSPVYDSFFNAGPFLKARQKVFNNLDFHKGDKILFVVVGTGADIYQVPMELVDITAIDYSEEMLAQAKRKFSDAAITFLQMDAQNLTFSDEDFDYVIASLVLSVVPDYDRTFSEMVRVTKAHGKIIIFDKFTSQLTPLKRLIRPMIKVLGTDIGLSFEKIYENYKDNKLIIEVNQPILFGEMYRNIRIRKS